MRPRWGTFELEPGDDHSVFSRAVQMPFLNDLHRRSRPNDYRLYVYRCQTHNVHDSVFINIREPLQHRKWLSVGQCAAMKRLKRFHEGSEARRNQRRERAALLLERVSLRCDWKVD